jgi:hypothetical protein
MKGGQVMPLVPNSIYNTQLYQQLLNEALGYGYGRGE